MAATVLFQGLFFGVMAFCMAATAEAADGVWEINQACAANTGCFSGDDPGFPVRIMEAGSYRLTSDLIVDDENANGIVVSVDAVSVDLNGFGIIREGCQQGCTPIAGSGVGVRCWDPGFGPRDPSLDARGLSVKNGSVTGMGSEGVLVSTYGEVQNIRARWNGTAGVGAGVGARILGNTTFGNGGSGIQAGASSVVSKNVTYENQGDGINASEGSVVLDNASTGNSGDGIEVAAGALVSGNSVRENTGYGLRLGLPEDVAEDAPGYTENVISDNNAGSVIGGVDAGGNSCDFAPCSLPAPEGD